MPQYILLLREAPIRFLELFARRDATDYRRIRRMAEQNPGRRQIRQEAISSKTKGPPHLYAQRQGARCDGPYAEAKEVMGRLFRHQRGRLRRSCRNVEGCPHLKYKGWIEVREIEPVPAGVNMSSQSSDQIHQSVDHLFRHQAGQMIATLTRIFGIKRLDQVERRAGRNGARVKAGPYRARRAIRPRG